MFLKLILISFFFQIVSFGASFCPNKNGVCCFESRTQQGKPACSCFWAPDAKKGRPGSMACKFAESCGDIERSNSSSPISCTEVCNTKSCETQRQVTCPFKDGREDSEHCAEETRPCLIELMGCMNGVLVQPGSQREDGAKKCFANAGICNRKK